MKEFGTTDGGFISLEIFLQYYIKACTERHVTVWQNLHAYGYRNDLRRVGDANNDTVENPSALPRYLISNDEERFRMIFNLLDLGGESSQEVWDLINRLPTCPSRRDLVVQLRGGSG